MRNSELCSTERSGQATGGRRVCAPLDGPTGLAPIPGFRILHALCSSECIVWVNNSCGSTLTPTLNAKRFKASECSSWDKADAKRREVSRFRGWDKIRAGIYLRHVEASGMLALPTA
jgi:hypothetical protein